MEDKSVDDICDLLEEKGFPDDVRSSFKDNEMDGDAIALGLASAPGPDWLKDIVPKAGQRFKIHKLLCSLCAENQSQSGQDWGLFSPGSSGNEGPFSPTLSTSSKVSSTPTSSKGSVTVSPKTTPKLSQKLPNPFPIPKFRANTEANFANKKMTDSDRKYVVQTLATMLMTYVQKPAMKHCMIVAKALIASFPFLRDEDEDEGEHSWKWFIYYRCQNVNRPSSNESASSSKRPRLSNEERAFHLYPPTEGEDEVAYGRNLELLRAEWAKPKPRPEAVKDLLVRTFSNRFDSYVNKNEPATLLEYLMDFPMLKKASLEFSTMCKRDNLCQTFEDNFSIWSRAIILYCKETQVKSTALQIETADYTDDLGLEECALKALRCLALTIGSLKTKKLGSGIPFLLNVVKRGTPPTEATEKGNSQPHIILFKDDDEEETLKQYFIAVEAKLMMETTKLTTSIFLCLAAHYIFNLRYHTKVGDVFLFLQEKVLELASKSVKRHPSSVSHFSGISRVFDQLNKKSRGDDEISDGDEI